MVTLYRNDSVNLSTGVVTRQDTTPPVAHVIDWTEELHNNNLMAFAVVLYRHFRTER